MCWPSLKLTDISQNLTYSTFLHTFQNKLKFNTIGYRYLNNFIKKNILKYQHTINLSFEMLTSMPLVSKGTSNVVLFDEQGKQLT